jgi:hypothetical protein
LDKNITMLDDDMMTLSFDAATEVQTTVLQRLVDGDDDDDDDDDDNDDDDDTATEVQTNLVPSQNLMMIAQFTILVIPFFFFQY